VDRAKVTTITAVITMLDGVDMVEATLESKDMTIVGLDMVEPNQLVEAERISVTKDQAKVHSVKEVLVDKTIQVVEAVATTVAVVPLITLVVVAAATLNEVPQPVEPSASRKMIVDLKRAKGSCNCELEPHKLFTC